MPIQRTPWQDDDGSGTTGTVINNAAKYGIYNDVDAYVGGTWTDVAFNAANFYATGGAGGVWTVKASNIQTLTTASTVNAITVLFALVNDLILSATAGQLVITLPSVPAPTRYSTTAFAYFVGATAGSGFVECVAGVNAIKLYPALGGALWPATSSMFLMGQITYPYR